MSKLGDELIQSLGEALAYARGEGDPAAYRVHVFPAVDVRAIRRKTGLSQQAFAARYGFALAALREWERGVRSPEGPARVLLTLIAREPETVSRILDAAE